MVEHYIHLHADFVTPGKVADEAAVRAKIEDLYGNLGEDIRADNLSIKFRSWPEDNETIVSAACYFDYTIYGQPIGEEVAAGYLIDDIEEKLRDGKFLDVGDLVLTLNSIEKDL